MNDDLPVSLYGPPALVADLHRTAYDYGYAFEIYKQAPSAETHQAQKTAYQEMMRIYAVCADNDVYSLVRLKEEWRTEGRTAARAEKGIAADAPERG